MTDLRRLSAEARSSPLTIDKIAALGVEDRERVKQAIQRGALRVQTKEGDADGRAHGELYEPEPTKLKVPDDLRQLVLGGQPPLRTDQMAGQEPNTAADVRRADFASWGVDVGDADNDDTALVKWNLEQYGVPDVSSLSDEQLGELRASRAAEQRAAQEEESRLLQFLTNRQADPKWGSDDNLLFAGADEVEEAVFDRNGMDDDQSETSSRGDDADGDGFHDGPHGGSGVEAAGGSKMRDNQASTSHTQRWDPEPKRHAARSSYPLEDAPDFFDTSTQAKPASTWQEAKAKEPEFDLSAGVLAVQRTVWRSSEAARHREQFRSPSASSPQFSDAGRSQDANGRKKEGSPGLWAVTEASVSGSRGQQDTGEDVHDSQYDSFPTHPADSHHNQSGESTSDRDPEGKQPSRPASTMESLGQWFGGVGVLFGSPPPTDGSAPALLKRRSTESVVPQADAQVKEGFMCPICMKDCKDAGELVECYERCSAAEPPTPPDSRRADEEEGAAVDMDRHGMVSPSRTPSDPSHAWANARPTEELQARRGSSPLDRRPPGGEHGDVNTNGTPAVPQPGRDNQASIASPTERREMYCLTCMERKTTVTDAFCHGCGQAHTNRMYEQELELRLRVSPYGFGLGFKDHYVHKVQPGSTAELSGLEIGDTIINVNGHSVVELPDIEVLKLIKNTQQTLVLIVRRVLPMQLSNEGRSDFTSPEGFRQNPFSPSDEGARDQPDANNDAVSPGLDFVTETSAVDEAEVSQGVRDSSYVKMMRERLEGYEARLAERDAAIKTLKSEKTRLAEELSAVLKQEDEKTAPSDADQSSMLDDMLPRLPTVSPTDYTLQNLCWSMDKHIAATRIAAAPLEVIANELPDRVETAIDAEVEFQSAAANQVRVSQTIDTDGEMTGAEQLAMSKASSRVISASDAKQQAEQRLSEALREIQTTVDHVQKTARLAEHHISKFAALLKEMPQLGKLIISNDEDEEVTW
eukprot:m.183882 g.183882  ORF g.183882 m.183882 type:complete len:979 (-) comp15965_c0_seq1:98-3034(-)